MKKKLLIITSRSEATIGWPERERYVKEFSEALGKKVRGFDVLFTTYQDMHFIVRNNKVQILDTRNDLDMSRVDWVHFKNWMRELEEASVLAGFFSNNHILYFNSEVNTGLALGKVSQMFQLAQAGLPVPDTFYAHQPQLKEIFKSGKLPQGFNYPLIMKASDGSKGDDNHLIKEGDRALDVLNDKKNSGKEYVLQNFIPNDGDLRLLFIGLEKQPIVFRRTAAEGSHLNNTSKGGAGNFLQPKDLPVQYIEDAKKAAAALGREISGVDIIVNEATGEHYILEVNATPALATGYGMDVKLDRFAKFVDQTQDVFEEE